LGHLNAQYVEECSVGEYTLFVSQLKRTISSKSEQPLEEQTISDDEDELSGQFEEEI
jgi:hypothetical protein